MKLVTENTISLSALPYTVRDKPHLPYMAQPAPLRKASGCNILTTVAFSCQVVSSIGVGSPAAPSAMANRAMGRTLHWRTRWSRQQVMTRNPCDAAPDMMSMPCASRKTLGRCRVVPCAVFSCPYPDDNRVASPPGSGDYEPAENKQRPPVKRVVRTGHYPIPDA